MITKLEELISIMKSGGWTSTQSRTQRPVNRSWMGTRKYWGFWGWQKQGMWFEKILVILLLKVVSFVRLRSLEKAQVLSWARFSSWTLVLRSLHGEPWARIASSIPCLLIIKCRYLSLVPKRPQLILVPNAVKSTGIISWLVSHLVAP